MALTNQSGQVKNYISEKETWKKVHLPFVWVTQAQNNFSVYKLYLGVLSNENREFKTNAEDVSKSGGQALELLIHVSNIHNLKNTFV